MEFKQRLQEVVEAHRSSIVSFKYANSTIVYNNDWLYSVIGMMSETSNDNEMAYLSYKLSMLRAEIDLYLYDVLDELHEKYFNDKADGVTLASITDSFVTMERDRECKNLPTLYTLIFNFLRILL